MSLILNRVGVDIGGTFTDVALAHASGLATCKVLTSYAQPEQAILDGIKMAVDKAGIAMGDIGQVIHGTTLVTNSLIERRGAKLAFITTEGFRDVIEMRAENRFEQYDLNLTLPKPMVPREHRLTLNERMAPGGEVLLPLDPVEVDAMVATIMAGDYEAVAIGLMHAYANNAHELQMADALRAAAPDLSISVSSVISPQMRELPRFNTVIANAYVQPQVANYLRRLVKRLKEEGVNAPVFMLHSGGGLISVDSAVEQPVRLLESGPAGGAIFAADFARGHGLDSVLSFDMGGTTAKICLIEGGAPKTASTFEVARTYRFKKGSGMTVSTPVVEMVEIGAGGGSIASIDTLGRIQVGPRSAASEPGPACYGRGAEEPTVTDANLLLGRLDPDNFAGGTIPLSVSACHTAVTQKLAESLAMTSDQAAYGVTETVDENMANAARVHAVENGRDIEHFTMVGFGGGAPLHACRLCEKLGIDELIIPPGAGVGSAIGFLKAPFSYEATRGLFQRLDAFDAASVNIVLAELEQEAKAFLQAGAQNTETMTQLSAFMRYAGQGWEIPVLLPFRTFADTDRTDIIIAFESAYRTLFGRLIDGLDIEITNWSLVVATVLPETSCVERFMTGTPVKALRTRQFFDAALRKTVDAQEVDRMAMTAGMLVEGPAIIIEDETTTIVTSGYRAVGQGDGSLRLTRKAERRMIASDTLSAIDYQIMWNRLIAVVEEQATTLIRTAFSTSVREAGDLSAGLFDRRGRMMAQAVTGTPGHVNAMAESVTHFVREIGAENIFEGDVFITNDPWLGTGHLHDITVVSPTFHNGLHIGFFACTAHVVDIGGRGFGPDANEVYEEGLLIPIMKFAEAGTVNQTLIRLVRANVREPDQVVGDLYSLAACNEAGDRRLKTMLGEFAIADLEALADFVIDTSCKATREAIAKVPDGTFSHTMQVDGYDDPVYMAVRLDVEGDTIRADFTGTSGMSRFGVNVPEVYTRAYACYGLKCAIAPQVPNNTGSLEPFVITAPEGCILAAKRPAPVSVRHVLGHLVPDVVLGALHKALPDTVPAEGASALWNIQISARASDTGSELRNAEVLMFNSGGTGARPALDGLSATAFPSGVSTMSVEATEHVGPIVVWRKDLREGSGGIGALRGGLGQTIEIEPRAGYDFYFNAMFDRVENAARGRDGGGAGAAGHVALADGTILRSKGRQLIKNGQRLKLSLPGGGGYGAAAKRDKALVAEDLRAGLITLEQARNDYGYEG